MLDITTGILKYCNAGHTCPVLTSPNGTADFFNITSDFPLGIMKDHEYQEYVHQFSSGSGILLYTDGVTDAENQRGEFYTRNRLLKAVQEHHNLHPREFIQAILTDIRQHTQDHPQSDDLTLLTFIYGPEWHINYEEISAQEFPSTNHSCKTGK